MIHVSWKILKREKGMYNEKIKYSNQPAKSIKATKTNAPSAVQ